MLKIEDIFYIKRGNSLELNKLDLDDNGMNYVSRTAKNNGVSATINSPKGIVPMPEKSISVALSGTVLEIFLQDKPYYTGYHMASLISILPLSDMVKLYYCSTIRANAYKYSFGRQANKTIKELLVPDLVECMNFLIENTPLYRTKSGEGIKND